MIITEITKGCLKIRGSGQVREGQTSLTLLKTEVFLIQEQQETLPRALEFAHRSGKRRVLLVNMTATIFLHQLGSLNLVSKTVLVCKRKLC